MINQVAKYINQESLLKPTSKILIGLSGGADSVALLRCLLQLDYSVIAAHCNFHLRGQESMRDQLFVEQLCNKLNIPLVEVDFDTYKHAEEYKVSIEMAARELRYNWFQKMLEKHECTHIAVAHHKDDNVETLLLNLARGSGIKGLTAIQPKNGSIVRPLLNVSRAEIINYLNEIKQDYVIDSTNLQDQFARNKIRLNIIPELEKINPSCQNNINNTISYLREIEKIYLDSIEKSKQRVISQDVILISELLKEVSPQTVLYEICYPLNFNSKQISSIYKSLYQTEEKTFFSKSHQLVRSKGALIIQDIDKESINDIQPKLHYKVVANDHNFTLKKDTSIAYFDAALIDEDALHIRKWNKGDFFIPFGMQGSKKLSDFFTDNKLTVNKKDSQWLLCHNNDIIWVIGRRTDNRYRVTNNTKKVLIITYK